MAKGKSGGNEPQPPPRDPAGDWTPPAAAGKGEGAISALTLADMEKLARAKHHLEQAKALVEAATSCGIDCRAYAALIGAVDQRIDRMRNTFNESRKRR